VSEQPWKALEEWMVPASRGTVSKLHIHAPVASPNESQKSTSNSISEFRLDWLEANACPFRHFKGLRGVVAGRRELKARTLIAPFCRPKERILLTEDERTHKARCLVMQKLARSPLVFNRDQRGASVLLELPQSHVCGLWI